jgi:hypothetical protein
MKKVGLADWRTSNGLPSASDPETEADRTPRESLLACMTANREPSNQSFETDREATVCAGRFLPLCGREAARTHVAFRPMSVRVLVCFGFWLFSNSGRALACRRQMLRCLGFPRFTGVRSASDRLADSALLYLSQQTVSRTPPEDLPSSDGGPSSICEHDRYNGIF